MSLYALNVIDEANRQRVAERTREVEARHRVADRGTGISPLPPALSPFKTVGLWFQRSWHMPRVPLAH